MSRKRFAKYDPYAPRFHVIKAKGAGSVVAFAYVEPWARRRADALVEQLGEPLVVIDLKTAKLVGRWEPSEIAVARRKAQPKLRRSEGGHVPYHLAGGASPIFVGSRD